MASTRSPGRSVTSGDIGRGKSPPRSKRGSAETRGSNTLSMSNTKPGDSNGHKLAENESTATNNDRTAAAAATTITTRISPTGEDGGQHLQPEEHTAEGDATAGDNSRSRPSSAKWRIFRGSKGNGGDKSGREEEGGNNSRRRPGRRNKRILPSEGGSDPDANGGGEAMTDPLVLPTQQLSTHLDEEGL